MESSNYRSVTPAMNNTRGGVRTASPAPGRGPSPGAAAKLAGGNAAAHYANRSSTPNRYDSFQNPPDSGMSSSPNPAGGAVTQSGLIRLTLRKPMGIVFEPMYDPNAPTVQRGVRICDLPRTGAAALSRKLEVGDELLSINDKTMSRLTFDEIMDFIIEADPEEVNLLFRRPNKETLKERAGIKTPSAVTSTGPGVKWVDDDTRKKKDGKKKEGKPKDKKTPRGRPKYRDDDETLQSEDVDYRKGKKKGRRKDPYETESFLDILIDTICANPDSVCRDRRRGDDDYYSDDDETFASRDDSTYVTYESEDHRKSKAKGKAKKAKGQNRDDDDSSTYQETEDDTLEDKRKVRDKDSTRLSPPPKETTKRTPTPDKTKKYEDDNTLETMDTAERAKHMNMAAEPEAVIPPLGLAPNPEPNPVGTNIPEETDDEGNPAPIREVEYDEFDQGADVSVMESLGGPSLLIEKQRQAQITAQRVSAPTPAVPDEIIDNFGKDYPLDFGFSRDQTIQNDPLRFYTFVVKGLLQEHEPEKVRLLDKLLAKYKGREDHLVQKLSVRYNKEEEEGDFEEAVRKEKDSAHARNNVEAARERIQNDFNPTEWPEKESKEADPEDDHQEEESGSDYSGDSIDGTSPAVIAQVSELLNYVYGKTSVPGQIDRVSTIMRAYEGREAVLLELLETKALIKANREKENAGNLPSFLRNSANAQRNLGDMDMGGDMPPVTPMAAQPPITDDISSMSGVSTPAGEAQLVSAGVLKQISVSVKMGRAKCSTRHSSSRL